ncbi:AAEL000286-PA [Aedes aegypti]|uniref:AAEL000286-PA n=1 Tax=Aedes aegypti TaxID=7159 RepID=Q17PL7_AEDAE|nr:AAEL000286-PA [Aedes aegypti]
MRAHNGPTIINDHQTDHWRNQHQQLQQRQLRHQAIRLGGLLQGCHFWLVIVTVIGLAAAPVGAGPRYSSRIVETKSGAIRGVILELHSKYLEPVEVFKAVPYAAPPVGNLRFVAPKKLPPWKGTKLADTFGPVCPQSNSFINRVQSCEQLGTGNCVRDNCRSIEFLCLVLVGMVDKPTHREDRLVPAQKPPQSAI